MSKAFDSTDHDILSDKLRNSGLSNSALSWFLSYLSQDARRYTSIQHYQAFDQFCAVYHKAAPSGYYCLASM